MTRSWFSWESKKIRKYFNESQKISIPSSVAQRVIQTRGPGLKILFVFRNQSFSIRVCSFSNECKYYYWRHMATHMDFPTSRQVLSGVHMAEHDLGHGNFISKIKTFISVPPSGRPFLVSTIISFSTHLCFKTNIFRVFSSLALA